MAERFRPFDWYVDDPSYYDIVFDLGTKQETQFLIDVHERHATTRGRRVLEPACGTGRLVKSLADRGWRATGFDLSPQMLAHAREKCRGVKPAPRFVAGDLASFEVGGRFDLAHCLVSTFKYVPTEEAAVAHLTRVAEALKPGGVYVLGMHTADYDDRAQSSERWVGERDGVRVACVIRGWPADRRSRTERVRSRMRVTTPDGVEQRLESNWTFRTWSHRQLVALLKRVPMLELAATYGFEHDITKPIAFDGERLDVVMVLRRR